MLTTDFHRLADALATVQIAARDAEIRFRDYGLDRDADAVADGMAAVAALVWASILPEQRAA